MVPIFSVRWLGSKRDSAGQNTVVTAGRSRTASWLASEPCRVSPWWNAGFVLVAEQRLEALGGTSGEIGFGKCLDDEEAVVAQARNLLLA